MRPRRRRRLRRGLAALLAPILAPVAISAHEGPPPVAIPEEGPPLAYELPAAGSYALPPIQRVADHELVDSGGTRARILQLEPGGFAFVAFVYLGCHDASGCPLALATLIRLDRALAARPDLARVRLATVSFDPVHDRPADLARLRDGIAPRSDWRFFTASGAEELVPVLADFGQDVEVLPAEAGGAPRLGHVLKVFLVDARGDVRNVYSAGFLDHRLLVRDVETLLLEP